MAAERQEARTAIGQRSSWLISPVCLGIMAVLALLAILAKTTVLASVLVFLLLVGACSRLWGERSLFRVHFSGSGEPSRVFPGDEMTMEWTVQNDKLLPLIWLELWLPLPASCPLWPKDDSDLHPYDDPIPEGEPYFQLVLSRRFAFLMAHQKLCWRAVWTARRRGLFSLSSLRICSGDGLGLAQTECRADSDTPPFAVYPAIQPVTVDPFLRNLWEASGDAKGYLEDPTIIKGNRAYQPSDPWKRINWRLAARGLPLAINLPETILPKSAHFIVDGESFGGPTPDSDGFEDALSLLASVLVGLEAAQVRCGLTLPKGRTTAPATYPCGSPTDELLYALAGYDFLPPAEPEGSSSDPPPAKPSRFDIAPALEACSAAGRCYYLVRDFSRLGGGLLERLETASLVLMPLHPEPAARGAAFDADLLPLERIRREVRHV
ncbi:MAG: hypothetical protein DBX44_02985 [Oscillospiraceae bacterium]|nr:MAG: hypothetical protein DBX44_02985 [Oscillospiraceae bacterium]